MEAILTRRSIRKFTQQPISDDLIEKLLRAAMSAPSAVNQQPWHFVVIDEKPILLGIQQFHPYASMLTEAPVAIAVCGDHQEEKSPGFWVQDCAAATENILLAAHFLGLGAVWVGLYPRQERVDGMKKLCGLPKHVTPLALVALGYPGEDKPPANRYNPERVHRNHW